MNSSEALKDILLVIEAIAAGKDPETGRPLPKGMTVSCPRVNRALFIAARALLVASINEIELTPKSAYGRTEKASGEKEIRLLADLDAGAPMLELANEHVRNVD